MLLSRLVLPFLLAGLLVIPVAGAKRLTIAPLDYDTHNICTVFSINEPAALWVTAAHCVVREETEETEAQYEPGSSAPVHIFTIQDQQAQVVIVIVKDDLAVLRTKKGVEGLRLAKAGPKIGDKVHVLGFPLGGEQVLYAEGTVANPHYTTPSHVWAWFAIPVCQGHSGSPILNQRGEVVSVFQRMTDVPCAPWAIGQTWETMVEDLGGLFEQR